MDDYTTSPQQLGKEAEPLCLGRNSPPYTEPTMTAFTGRRSRQPASEEAQAAARVILALTMAVGAMAGLIGVVTASALAVVAIPAALAGGSVMLGRSGWAAWCGVVAWLMLAPSADGEAIMAPLAMAVLCAAIAIGPDRLLSWIRREIAGHGSSDTGSGWIEEDGIRIG